MPKKADEEPVVSPFTVAIDTAEGNPFSFKGMYADADKKGRPLVVPTKFKSLGRYPSSLGDYSIVGCEDRIGIERKSMEDAWGTILGWPSSNQPEGSVPRRERFKVELSNLSCVCSAVVVEAEFAECLSNMPTWGTKTAATNRKIFSRSVLAFMQDYAVPWIFCRDRRMAEVQTYRWLSRWWKHHGSKITLEDI